MYKRLANQTEARKMTKTINETLGEENSGFVNGGTFENLTIIGDIQKIIEK